MWSDKTLWEGGQLQERVEACEVARDRVQILLSLTHPFIHWDVIHSQEKVLQEALVNIRE